MAEQQKTVISYPFTADPIKLFHLKVELMEATSICMSLLITHLKHSVWFKNAIWTAGNTWKHHMMTTLVNREIYTVKSTREDVEVESCNACMMEIIWLFLSIWLIVLGGSGTQAPFSNLMKSYFSCLDFHFSNQEIFLFINEVKILSFKYKILFIMFIKL